MSHRELLVTGSSGFVGSHLCRAIANPSRVWGVDLVPPSAPADWHDVRADIRSSETLADALSSVRPRAIVHLAAVAEAVVPFAELEELVSTNVIGTVKLLEAGAPELCLFASSSAVYGNAYRDQSKPVADSMKPVGAYGVSKMQAELAIAEWAHLTGRPAVALRFGNVVGPGCRGLIPYLVARARKDPEGSTPTRLRGGGRVVRDYVPVDYTVSLLEAAVDMSWRSGVLEMVNVGTGRGRTNGDVAAIVKRVLSEEGYELDLRFDAPLERGEADYLVLDVDETAHRFAPPIPSEEAVDEAIATATRFHLSSSE